MGFEPQNDKDKPLNLYHDHDEPKMSPLEALEDTKHDDHQVQSKVTPDSSPKHLHDHDSISGLHTEPKNLSRSSSSSSSSSLSSSESFKKDGAGSGTITESSSRNESLSDASPPTPQWSMISNTPRAGSGHLSYDLPPNHPDNWNSMFNNSSALKSPRIQTMSRPAGYDPNRIPSHVFSTKANTTMEWSVASNESLFSIHMGNNSFSRDHILQFGDTTTTNPNKPDDSFNEVKSSNESSNNGFSSHLPPVLETTVSDNDKKFTHEEEDHHGTDGHKEHEKLKEIKTKMDQETPNTTEKGQNIVQSSNSAKNQVVGLSTSSNNLLNGKGSPEANNGSGTPNNAPRASNESATSSTGSFAFPVLVEVGKGGASFKDAPLKAIDEEKREDIQPQNNQAQTPTTPKAATEGGGAAAGGGGGLFSIFTNFPKCC